MNPFLAVAFKLCPGKSPAEIYKMEAYLKCEWEKREVFKANQKTQKSVFKQWKTLVCLKKQQVETAKSIIVLFLKQHVLVRVQQMRERKALRVIRIHGDKMKKKIRKMVQSKKRKLNRKLKLKKKSEQDTQKQVAKAKEDVDAMFKDVPLTLSHFVNFKHGPPDQITDMMDVWTSALAASDIVLDAGWNKMIHAFKCTYPNWSAENPDISMDELFMELYLFLRTRDGVNTIISNILKYMSCNITTDSTLYEYSTGIRIMRAYRGVTKDNKLAIGVIRCIPDCAERKYNFGPLNGFNIPMSFRLPGTITHKKSRWTPLIRINLVCVPLAFHYHLWGPLCILSLATVSCKVFHCLLKWVRKRKHQQLRYNEGKAVLRRKQQECYDVIVSSIIEQYNKI